MAKWLKATKSVLSEFDRDFNERKKQTDTFYTETVGENVFYISSVNGNDQNDGRSTKTPWKSCEMLKNTELNKGDAILFECGSAFRERIDLVSGVTYSSYGTGAKPMFYGSIDASSPMDWESIGSGLYRFKQHIVWHNDIGNIVFDHGAAWGIKIQKCDDGDMSLALHKVTNGQTFFEDIPSVPFRNGMDLPKINLAYYHDPEGYIYLYSSLGNPAEVFSSIELSQSVKIFSCRNAENVIFSNLHFSCIGCFAIRTVGCRNMTVRNCAFEFIGGAIQFGYENPSRNYRTRYGNAIENWGECDGMTVENCYFNQIYDAGITTQSNDEEAHQKNLRFVGNVFECNQYAFELWSGGPKSRFTNILVQNNICKNVGDGMTTQRPDKGHESFFNSRGRHPMTNCRVIQNIVNGSVGTMLRCNQLHTDAYQDGYLIDENVYIHREGLNFGLISQDYPEHNHMLQDVKYCEDTVTMLSNDWFESKGVFYYMLE